MTISQTRLANFLTLLQAATDRYYNVNFPTLDTTQISFGGGKKYLKVVKTDNQTSVWGFIALVDVPAKGVKAGDVLKASSWKAPALNGARGTILDANVISIVGPHGPAYKDCKTGWGDKVDVSDLVLTD